MLDIKLSNLSTLYRSPSQSTDEFVNFLSKFEDSLFSTLSKKPLLTCILGGLNAKSPTVSDKIFVKK